MAYMMQLLLMLGHRVIRVLKSGPVRFFSLFGRQLSWADSFSLPKGVGLATGLKATSCNQSWITNHSIW